MKKKSVILMVLLLLAFIILPARAATTGTIDYLTYSIENEEVTITGCDTYASGTLTVPETIEGYPVTVIGNSAFNGCKYLSRVVLPDTVREIRFYAFFKCTSLTAIELPASLETIDNNALLYCSKLTELVLPKNYSGFSGSIVRDTGITAFQVEEGHGSYSTDENGVLFNKDKTALVAYPPKRVGAYDVPEGVTEIGYGAFMKGQISAVTLPNSLISIGEKAFAYTSISEISLPAGLRSIGIAAFEETKLTEFEVPPLVTEIGNSTFYLCRSLQRVVFHSGVTSVGYYAFGDCTSLCEIVFYHTPERALTLTAGGFQRLPNDLTIYVPNAEDINPAISGYEWKSTSLQYVSLSPTPEKEPLELTVSNGASGAGAVLTPPANGWEEGTNTFTVSCGSACVVAVSHDGGATYTRLAATATDSGYSFTAESVTAETIIAVTLVGDANGDGKLSNADITRLCAAYAGKVSLSPLQQLAVDVNGSGDVTNADITRLCAAYAGKVVLSW